MLGGECAVASAMAAVHVAPLRAFPEKLPQFVPLRLSLDKTVENVEAKRLSERQSVHVSA